MVNVFSGDFFKKLAILNKNLFAKKYDAHLFYFLFKLR